MPDWRTRLGLLARMSGELPEAFTESFEVRPPAGTAWPEGVPECPPLAEFYRLCDGGDLYHYEVVPLAEVAAETEELGEWLFGEGPPEVGPEPGRFLVFGRHREAGSHLLVWAPDGDRVLLFSPDDDWIVDPDEGWPLIGRPMDDFLNAMFSPPAKPSDEREAAWAQAMAMVGDLA